MATPIPDREELERRLGGVYTLDGSFSSLWAIEMILSAIRRLPQHSEKVSWVAVYLADLFARAFDEMGMNVSRFGVAGVHATGPISYRVDVEQDLKRLILPPKMFPSFYKLYWMPNRVLGTAYTAFYGLATIFQNHEWAQTDHDQIGNQRDRMDRAVPWLTEEYARQLGLPSELQELARRITRSMAWPPLGYAQNERGAHNLPRLANVLVDADAESSRTVLDACVANQDRACQLLAAAAAMQVGVPPDTRHEAHVYRQASQLLGVRQLPFIKRSIEELLAPLESPNLDADHPKYAAAFRASPAQGIQLAREVLAHEPDLPTFHCCVGWHQEQLGRQDEALDSYNRAIQLKPDYAQALLNRGALRSMMGKHRLAADDFVKARTFQPENVHLTMNLLVNYFMDDRFAPQEYTPSAAPKPDAPGASAPGAALRQLLVRYGEKQISLDQAMRAMLGHEHYLVPSVMLSHHEVHDDGVMFSTEQRFPPGEMWVFTDNEAAQRAQRAHGALGLYTAGQHARTMVECFEQSGLSVLRINPQGPESEGFLFSQRACPLLNVWLTGLALEDACKQTNQDALREAFLMHDGFLLVMSDAQPMITRDAGGITLHALVTADRGDVLRSRFGAQATLAPIPAANLMMLMEQTGATSLHLLGLERVVTWRELSR